MIKKLLNKAYYAFTKIACLVAPYKIGPYLMKFEFKKNTGENLNLKNPRNLIEKITWMQFHTDTSLWTMCADKYLVREYVKEKGLAYILPKLYGHWNQAEEIDWDSLPGKFIMKTNNSCGQNIIVRDKELLDISLAKRKITRWLKEHYGHQNAQLHYLRIKPKVIVEELLEDSELNEGENITDYKFFCFNGKPECIFVMTGREGKGYHITAYDSEWHNISKIALKNTTSHFGNEDIKKPKNFDMMLKYASILSEGIPHVRVDFYNIGGKIYFGEMTFTPGYGNRTKDFSEYLGSKIDLTKIPQIR